MKKLTFLVSMVLACVAFSAANSVTITQGSGTLSGAGLQSALYTFNFNGQGAGITVPGVLGDFGIGGGLPECNPCDPRTTNIELLRDFGATVLHQGNTYVTGGLVFEPVSFTYSIAQNGTLTVDYRATSQVSLNICVGIPSLSCYPGPTFVSNPNQLWYVQATFTPFQGEYVFNNATFSTSPIPESGTLLLLGTGLVGIVGAVRKNLFR